MATGTYNSKTIPPREVVVDTLEMHDSRPQEGRPYSVDTLEVYDTRSEEARQYSIKILEAEEELNQLLHELWPDFFEG